MKDYFFSTSRTDTLDKNQVTVSDEVKQLFYLPGSGTMQDSWQVAMKDETGSFAALLKSYEYATTQEEKSTILDHILYAMAGADQTVNPRASHIDEKKFTVLEKVYGIQFKRSNSWNGPVYERIYGVFASGEIRQIASVEKRQFGSAEIRQFESIEKSQS